MAERLKYESRCGDHIEFVAQKAIDQAIESNCLVRFLFNGVALEALPSSSAVSVSMDYDAALHRSRLEYEASPKGIADKKRREMQERTEQARVDQLISLLPKLETLDEHIRWARELAEIGTGNYDKGKAIEILESHGYIKNENTGNDAHKCDTKEGTGRYIMGQVISCFSIGMPPHGITTKFADEYLAMK
jgi:hypothetical protein